MALCLLAIGAIASWWVHQSGYTLYFGDAEAHLNIARRVVDSRTPGYEQFGTVWLPLVHALMVPLVRFDSLWRTGLAGAAVGLLGFVLAGTWLYGAARSALGSVAAGICAVALFALNPNVLYLQSIPMSESVFFAGSLGLVFFIVRFAQEPALSRAVLAGMCCAAACLTRYDGWFLIPLSAAIVLWKGGRVRWPAALVFALVAGAAPVYWLAHNAAYYGDPLEFYNGPYSTKAIYQRGLDAGGPRQPGDGDLRTAWLYYRSAALLCSGFPLAAVGLAGAAVAMVRRNLWVVLLLATPSIFYVVSIYTGGAELFVPLLPPHSYYNNRYGLAAIPFLAFSAAAFIGVVPDKVRAAACAAIVIVATLPWLASAAPESWICWKESQVNSVSRRAWTEKAAAYLRDRYRPGAGVFFPFGDLTGVMRSAGIPLRETLHDGNGPLFTAALVRPDLILREGWVVAQEGDQVSKALNQTTPGQNEYVLVRRIEVKDAKPVEIYRRITSLPIPQP